MMQIRRDFDAAQALSLRAEADERNRITVSHLSMASRRIVEDYPESAHWYALQVWERRELAVEKSLQDAAVIAVVPVEEGEEVIRRGRKWRTPDRPWMPGYVLVKIVWSAAAAMALRRQKHVIGIVGGLERPVRIPDKNVRDFSADISQRIEAERQRKADWSYPFRLGQLIRINCGPFLGFTGELMIMRNGKPPHGQAIIGIFGRETPVDMPLACFDVL
ncbi:hypothetical protein BJF92_11250 [Rhizobium rhizosphaerae]|uniref:Transcription termination/antitermination protein NusG n=1 Tax=Xaviernesmea rhizosphaerae TaxID=1672749 RepID=A0A1Q9AMM1_9HYPH|nr:transcription termination/antitermination NusG family protein [Xaviernesmea rhizosphaerae]OLP56657.1 hypothetical protein BJF92_11250 [Xaviernesmea rhizosphaerae]